MDTKDSDNQDVFYNSIVIKRQEAVGQPVILIHGLNSSHRVWDGFCQAMPSDFAISRIQMRGFDGLHLSSRPCIKAVRDDIIAYIQEYELDNPIIIGHSLGGFLGLWIASQFSGLGPLIILDALPFMGGALNPFLTSMTTSFFARYVKNKVLLMEEKSHWKTTPWCLFQHSASCCIP